MMDMPPVGMDAGMGGVPMDNGMGGMPMDNGMGDMSMGDDMNYGADFDAGVDADENTDPKKFIQQLTGKLSQSLRKYNQSLPQPDEDLDKYVAGMIIKQSIEGLSQEAVSEILDKVKSGEEPQSPDSGMEQQPMDMNGGMDDGMGMPQGNMGQMPPMGGQGQMPSNESRSRFGFNIDELLIKNVDASEKTDQQKQYIPLKNNGGYRQKPYTSKSFT